MAGTRKRIKSKMKRFFHLSQNPESDQETSSTNQTLALPAAASAISLHAQGDSQSVNRAVSPSASNLHDLDSIAAESSPRPTITPATVAPKSSIVLNQMSTESDGWAGLRLFAGTLSKCADTFGPLKQATEVLVSFITTFESVAKNRKDYQELKDQLNTLCNDISQYFDSFASPTMTPSIKNLEKGLLRETDFISKKQQEQSEIGRYWSAENDAEEMLKCYQRIQSLLQRLSLNASLGTWKAVGEILTDSRLSRLSHLPNSPAAYYRSAESASLRRGGCTQNTRADVLGQLYAWSLDSSSQKIYWLNGMAGTGKTTIAYSLCDLLERDQRLAASFFCSRQLPQCRDVNRIVPSLAYQLSRFSQPFCNVISRLLEANPDVHNQLIGEQFKQLVVDPVKQVKDALPTNLVMVVDALDECEANAGVNDILIALLSYSHELPIKFFVASRPDANILHRMRDEQAENLRTEMRLHELEHQTVRKDIEMYLRAELEPHMRLSIGELDTLVERSGVFFIYAATAVRYIGGNNFSRKKTRLAEVLGLSNNSSNASEQDIDRLYSTILDTALDDPSVSDSDRSEMLQILHTIVCAREPLSVNVIAGLLKLDGAESANAALLPLLSVLQVSDTTKVVTTLHESFPNYMLSEQRSGKSCCKAEDHNNRLARLCFDQIGLPSPPFNICKLESSFMWDKDVCGLEARIENAISKELHYACRYWGTHLRLASHTQELFSALVTFVSERIFLWVEVMNLKGLMGDAVTVMNEVETWSEAGKGLVEDARALIQDERRLVTSLASSPIRLSTPHIYVSALSFWPTNSPVAQCYAQGILRLIGESSTAMAVRRVTPLATINTQLSLRCFAYAPNGLFLVTGAADGDLQIWDPHTGRAVGERLGGHTGSVRSVSYSPNGERIVSGSDDRTVRIWDSHTRQLVGDILEGHASRVNSVAVSPDSRHIVSGSWDRTIRIWDAFTGEKTCQPIEETDDVNSVVYSPDGKRIISGSDSWNICIWDSLKSQPIGQPIEGHTKRVRSVTYSPDGKFIAFGSKDNTICIWDVPINQPRGEPLKGHTDTVRSIAYSPDGTYLVSGSKDYTVRIWDGITGQPIGQPLTGHTSVVVSVSYSPNSKYIASASRDGTIHIWDALIGPPVGQPLESHTSSVYSVAYSPDSKHIVSGSYDKTIRIWDALTGQPVGQPLQGPPGSVWCVAYSPDGKHIISGSGDWTIRIWDALTGQAVGQPLEGHTDEINSVAYSPDGKRIASGSDDKTVRIWDVPTREAVGQPLTGHTGSIWSVIYSPSGEYIISGSGDNTIRIWDALAGQPVGQALQGHAGIVTSLAYSPNGAYIISGSDDETIRIWDALTGYPVGQPLKGHTDLVWSVTYSHDGKHIISGSEDNTICIWDAQTGQPVGQPLEGHTSTVRSVACSPDGNFMASGSYDHTIRVWNLQTSRVISESISLRTELPSASYSASATDKDERPKTHICSSACQIDGNHRPWTLNEDGWVVVDGNKLLVWVPPDLRGVLVRPQNVLVTSSKYGALYLDFDDCRMGEHWADHFMPLKSSNLLSE